MANRRSFIKTLSLGTLAAALLPRGVNAYPRDLPLVGDDGLVDWIGVKDDFTLISKLTYLNNGTLGPSPKIVSDAYKEYIDFVNRTCIYKGQEIGREKAATFVNAKVAEISLTHNTTEGINMIVWGLPLKKGDEVIMTTQEHVGNAVPWLNRAYQDKIKVVTFEPSLTENGVLNQLEGLISNRTKVLALPHVSCTTGQRFPVKQIASLCQSKGIYFMVDGAHGAGALHLDMEEIGCDFYATCAHKWLLGPKGCGFVYLREELIEQMLPKYAGAYSDTSFSLDPAKPQIGGYNLTAHRFDYGTQSAALYKAMAKAMDYMDALGTARVQERIESLAQRLQEGLLSIDEVEMLSPTEPESRSMMIGFRPKDVDFLKFGKMADEAGFRVRVVPEAGLNSIRVSTHIYNDEQQIDNFLSFVREAV